VGTWEISIATSAKSFVSQVLVASRPAESDEVAVVPGQNVEVGVVVSSLVASLKGKVAGTGGQPAPGAIVMLRAADAAVDRRLYGKRTARTDQNGEYATEGLPPGRYQVAASFDVQTAADVDWSNPSLATVTLEENQTATLNLAL
jgi:protocatechuate 3,4-dioxygenase beta subunit